MGSRKRVAVIGAGPCGMGAVKELRAEGIEPVCFERTGHIGGLWRYHDDDTEGIASVMKTTIINTSKELGAISDCPPPAEFPNYMHHTMMYQYLSILVKEHDGLKYINFFQQAINVVPAEDYQVLRDAQYAYFWEAFDVEVVNPASQTERNVACFRTQFGMQSISYLAKIRLHYVILQGILSVCCTETSELYKEYIDRYFKMIQLRRLTFHQIKEWYLLLANVPAHNVEFVEPVFRRFYTNFRTAMNSFRENETGRWVVTTKDTRNGTTSTATFDGVMVCVGHHVFPNIPSFPGTEEFRGKIMHTHSLKKVDGFQDQRVVVVGVGNSGMDAAVEISSVAKQVYLSSRRGTWVLPRVGPYGHPFDAAALRRWMHFIQKLLPYSYVCSMFEKTLNKRFNHSTYNLKPKHRALSQHPTVSDTLPIKLLSGTVVVRGGIKEFTKTGVVFEGEKDVTEVDAVILATGYKIKFPFLSDDILPVKDNRVKLYKNVYPPHLPHPTLAILGLIQPNGPGFPPGEMQCRWSTMVMSGKCTLPSQEEMLQDILKKEEFRRKRFVDSPRHTVQVDFIDYQDELAELIGAKPNFLKMAFTDPKLFWACMTGPSLPYQYRLTGPHSWEGARNAILTYKDRVKAPLKKPGQIQHKNKKHFMIGNLGLQMIFLLPVVLWFVISVITRT